MDNLFAVLKSRMKNVLLPHVHQISVGKGTLFKDLSSMDEKLQATQDAGVPPCLQNTSIILRTV